MPDWAGFIAWSGLQRLELCVFVFAGALLMAIAAIAVVNRVRQGHRNARHGAAGDKILDMLALGLCLWLGYAFVNEPSQVPGIAALCAVSVLAAALGAHVMLTTHEQHAHALAHCGVRARRHAAWRVAWDGDSAQRQPRDDFTQRWSGSNNPRRTQPCCAALPNGSMRMRSHSRHQVRRQLRR
jgi:hypothetical protein